MGVKDRPPELMSWHAQNAAGIVGPLPLGVIKTSRGLLPAQLVAALLLLLLGPMSLLCLRSWLDPRASLWEFVRNFNLLVVAFPVLVVFFIRIPLALLFAAEPGVLNLREMFFRYVPRDKPQGARRAIEVLITLNVLLLVLSITLSSFPTAFERAYEDAMLLTYSLSLDEAESALNSLWKTRPVITSWLEPTKRLNHYESGLVDLGREGIAILHALDDYDRDPAVWEKHAAFLSAWHGAFGRDNFHHLILSSIVDSALAKHEAAERKLQAAESLLETEGQLYILAFYKIRQPVSTGYGDPAAAQRLIGYTVNSSFHWTLAGAAGGGSDRWIPRMPLAALLYRQRSFLAHDSGPVLEYDGRPLILWEVMNYAGGLQISSGHADAALRLWTELRTKGRTGVIKRTAEMGLCEVYTRLGRYEEAEEMNRSCLERDPAYFPGRVQYIVLRAKQQHYVDALMACDRLLLTYRPDPQQPANSRDNARAELASLLKLWLMLEQGGMQGSAGMPQRLSPAERMELQRRIELFEGCGDGAALRVRLKNAGATYAEEQLLAAYLFQQGKRFEYRVVETGQDWVLRTFYETARAALSDADRQAGQPLYELIQPACERTAAAELRQTPPGAADPAHGWHP